MLYEEIFALFVLDE